MKKLFISYAESDTETALEIIGKLREEGYTAVHGEVLFAADALVVFMSEESADSPDVRKDITTAQEKNIPVLAVYLENIKAIEQLVSVQSIMKYRMDYIQFWDKTKAALIEILGLTPPEPEPEPESAPAHEVTPASTAAIKRISGSAIAGIAGAVVVFVLLVGLAVHFLGNRAEPDPNDETDVPVTTTSATTATATTTAASTTAPATEATTTATSPQGMFLHSIAGELLGLVNAERSIAGLSRLSWDDKLNETARLRVAELPLRFEQSQRRPDGRGWNTVLEDTGISYRTSGENIGRGGHAVQGTAWYTPVRVVSSWMESGEHRENILNPDFEVLGAAAYELDDVMYYVLHFGARDNSSSSGSAYDLLIGRWGCCCDSVTLIFYDDGWARMEVFREAALDKWSIDGNVMTLDETDFVFEVSETRFAYEFNGVIAEFNRREDRVRVCDDNCDFCDFIVIRDTEYCLLLTFIDLFAHELTNDDIVPLGQMTNLRELDLGGNYITDIIPLIGLSNLELLDMWNNEISELQQNILEAALPDCRILW
jgi:uncharacterized protein YkwD